MPSRHELWPEPMRRVAVVAPETRLRRVLVEVADVGRFEPDPSDASATGPVTRLAERAADTDADVTPELAIDEVDAEQLAADGAMGLLLGEASLEQVAAGAHPLGRCRVVPGWVRSRDVDLVRARLGPLGGALADLPGRRGMIPPTAHTEGAARAAFRPLVTTYATVPYRNIDPTMFAAAAYLVMFGMMFGDVGHGAAIVLLGLLAVWLPAERVGSLRAAAPFLIGAGVAATVFGFLYGEAFGPTGLVPTLWLRPLDEPETLLLVAVALGGLLLALTFVMSIVNRWREGGVGLALYDPSGIAGAVLLLGVTGWAIGATADVPSWWWQAGVSLVVLGALLVFVGLVVRSGASASGFAEAVVELFDTLLRLGSNIVSFARLAAFGLTHAVITAVVWEGTIALWDRDSIVGFVSAVALFAVGNLAAFALGALVAAIQALRLEYYELFSRLFATSGRPFTPWHVPARRWETP